jgi:hypothetical protein
MICVFFFFEMLLIDNLLDCLVNVGASLLLDMLLVLVVILPDKLPDLLIGPPGGKDGFPFSKSSLDVTGLWSMR